MLLLYTRAAQAAHKLFIWKIFKIPHNKLIHISFMEQTQKSGCYEMINNSSNRLPYMWYGLILCESLYKIIINWSGNSVCYVLGMKFSSIVLNNVPTNEWYRIFDKEVYGILMRVPKLCIYLCYTLKQSLTGIFPFTNSFRTHTNG